MANLLLVYAVFSGLILVSFVVTYRKEPTAHGQAALIPMGCAMTFLWPLFVAYLIVGSPMFAWLLWKEKTPVGDRTDIVLLCLAFTFGFAVLPLLLWAMM